MQPDSGWESPLGGCEWIGLIGCRDPSTQSLQERKANRVGDGGLLECGVGPGDRAGGVEYREPLVDVLEDQFIPAKPVE
jgi:hypothetical protein